MTFYFSRFLYPIYPLICVAASAVIESFPDLFRDKHDPHDSSILVKVMLTLAPATRSMTISGEK